MLLERHAQNVSTLAREAPLLGLALTVHRNTRWKPIAFARRPYLVELYTEGRDITEGVLSKAVQTGISELLIQLALDAAGWRSPGRIVAYVLPNYTVRNRFVQNRINPLLLRIPEYRDRCPGGAFEDADAKGAESMGLKRFGRGALMFLGSNTRTEFVEFSADAIIVDEYDQCDPENLALAGDRLRESPYPQRFYVGNPTRARGGISSELLDSDGRRWHHQCHRCGERQPLDWFKNVVERDDGGKWIARDRAPSGPVRPVCRRCSRPFDLVADGGSWVAERPGHRRRGYQLSRLDVLGEPLADLLGEWIRAQGDPDRIRAFYTGVLGLPHEGSGARLTVEHLERATRGEAPADRDGVALQGSIVTAGVDVGVVLHVTVSIVERDEKDNPIRRSRLVCTARTFEEVADVFRRYNVAIAVVDAMPETHKAQELRDAFVASGGTVVWLCRFHPTPRIGAQKYGMRLDYSTQVIQVDRTAAFDVSHEDILAGRRHFPEDAWGVEGWADQMQAPARIYDEEKGRITWEEGGKADHFRLSDLYDRVACDLLDQGGSYFAG